MPIGPGQMQRMKVELAKILYPNDCIYPEEVLRYIVCCEPEKIERACWEVKSLKDSGVDTSHIKEEPTWTKKVQRLDVLFKQHLKGKTNEEIDLTTATADDRVYKHPEANQPE